MKASLYIPEPCHEDWSKMSLQEKGRHCESCQKLVVDFTHWETDEIFDYLKSNVGTCGRFLQTQISPNPLPEPIESSLFVAIKQSKLNYVARMAAMVVLCFHLASCGENSQAKTNEKTEFVDTTKTSKPIESPVPPEKHGEVLMGDTIAVLPKPPNLKHVPKPVKDKSKIKGLVAAENTTIQGEPAVLSVPDSSKCVKPDSIKEINTPMIMGKIAMPKPSAPKVPKPSETVKGKAALH